MLISSMELNDTAELMGSDDYRERFKAEYYQLCIRIKKLEKMVRGYSNNTLDFEPDCPLWLLKKQLKHMRKYRRVLKKRAFIENVGLNNG